MRRTLTIIAVVILVLGLALLGYFLFFSKNSGLTAQPGVSAGTNPFGTPSQNTAGGTDTAAGNTVDTGGSSSATQVAPHLVEITDSPVAKGFIALDASTTPVVALSSTTPVSSPGAVVEVRYIDRESGNMYAYGSGTDTRLTNHTAPGVEETSWLPDGSVAYIRFLATDQDKSEHIETYALPADGSDGRLLSRDLSAVLVRGLGSIFTLMPSTAGSVGTVEKPDTSAPTTLFSSPLSALTLSVAGPNFVAYTNPSASLPGYLFLINGANGGFSPILGPLPGLAAVGSHSGKSALVSYLVNGTPTLAVADTSTGALIPLPLATLAEKCVWTKDDAAIYCAVPASTSAGLPDSWYAGTTSFSDRLWKIDLTARVATQVADLSSLSKEPVDAVALTLDPEESTLVFMNKHDDSLWAYTF